MISSIDVVQVGAFLGDTTTKPSLWAKLPSRDPRLPLEATFVAMALHRA